MNPTTPTKIKNDAIVEALVEIRFKSDDMGEIVVGRLSDLPQWKGFVHTRLANADIPEAIRVQDPKLQHLPLIEFKYNNDCAVRFGPNVISYHEYPDYCGWPELRPKLADLLHSLFERTTNIEITRLGLRYINLLQTSKHLLSSMSELELQIFVREDELTEKLNLSYVNDMSEEHHVMTRVASPEFVSGGKVPDDLVAAIDVDVFTPNGFLSTSEDHVIEWIEKAHTFEKQSFFNLIPSKIVEQLEE